MPSQLQPSSLSTLRIAAGYMVLSGIAGLAWPLFRFGPNHPEFRAQSFAYRAGAQTRELTLAVASWPLLAPFLGTQAGIRCASHRDFLRLKCLRMGFFEGFFEWTANASCPSIFTIRHSCVERAVVVADLSTRAVADVLL